jgi:hypothetical protein
MPIFFLSHATINGDGDLRGAWRKSKEVRAQPYGAIDDGRRA